VKPASKESHAVGRVYEELKTLSITYGLKPGSRVNESTLARQLGVSRTPLREALNRLVVDGFLDFTPSQGFFRKNIDPAEIFDLYEMRQTLEVASLRLAVRRATEQALDEIEEFLSVSVGYTSEEGTKPLVQLDEGFHERLILLTGNRQLLTCLQSVNDRIRFFRWIDMEEERRRGTQSQHLEILRAIRKRDAEEAAAILGDHIVCRRDQILRQVKEGYARIYTGAEPGYYVMSDRNFPT
jgi:DNA-binding GntR family transcriptional regulator